MYTTDVVTTVRFTLRHDEKLTKDQFMDYVQEFVDFSHMVGGEDLPTIECAQVLSDVIENANQVLEEEDA